MRRRAHIEWLGHTSIRVTSACFQKTIDLIDLSAKKEVVDLLTGKRLKVTTIFCAWVHGGTGKLGDPFSIRVMAEVNQGNLNDVCSPFSIYNGKEQIIEVDFP